MVAVSLPKPAALGGEGGNDFLLFLKLLIGLLCLEDPCKYKEDLL